MPAFFDVTCQACRHPYGWFGEANDWPACQRCGFRPSPVEIEKLQKARAHGGCSGPAYSRAKEWMEKNLPEVVRSGPRGIVVELGVLLDSVAPEGSVRAAPRASPRPGA